MSDITSYPNPELLVGYVTDGLTREFTASLQVQDTSQVRVLLNGVSATDYTISIQANDVIKVVFAQAPAAQQELSIYRYLDLQQKTQFNYAEGLDISTLNNAFQEQTKMINQVGWQSLQGIVFPPENDLKQVPPKQQRQNTLMGFDQQGYFSLLSQDVTLRNELLELKISIEDIKQQNEEVLRQMQQQWQSLELLHSQADDYPLNSLANGVITYRHFNEITDYFQTSAKPIITDNVCNTNLASGWYIINWGVSAHKVGSHTSFLQIWDAHPNSQLPDDAPVKVFNKTGSIAYAPTNTNTISFSVGSAICYLVFSSQKYCHIRIGQSVQYSQLNNAYGDVDDAIFNIPEVQPNNKCLAYLNLLHVSV